MSWSLVFASTALATRMAMGLTPRADMAEQRGDAPLPPGPKWVLMEGDRVVGMGGLEPSGAGASLGWLLVGDLTRREWAMMRRAVREVLTWARSHGIKRVYALVAEDRPAHAAMLAGVGFKLSGQEDGAAVMKAELT